MKNYKLTNKLIEVYGVGLGFVCVKRGVFEKIKRPWFRMGVMPLEVNNVQYDIPIGEDLYFCETVSKNNHKIIVDPNTVVGHVKGNIVC